MNEIKPWYLSVGFWSALFTVLFSVAATAGIAIKVPPENMAQAVVTVVPVVLAVVSGLAAAWGRGRATQQLAFSRRTLRLARDRTAVDATRRRVAEERTSGP